MITYSPIQWIAIDIANQFGLDKLIFEERLDWVKQNLNNLEKLTEKADPKTRPLYVKAVQALRLVQQGKPTGHLVGLDAICSGIQIMSALSGCRLGAKATGLVIPNKRPDAYTYFTKRLNQSLTDRGLNTYKVPRQKAKEAIMTAFYGSEAVPKRVFDEDDEVVDTFKDTMQTSFQGAFRILNYLLKGWDRRAYKHKWQLPDGFDVVVNSMEFRSKRIRVAELGDSSFTYNYYENTPISRGISLPANVIHSVDAYIVRCMHRRCNYDVNTITQAKALLEGSVNNLVPIKGNIDKVIYYLDLYNKNNIADIVILPYLDKDSVLLLPEELITKLLNIINTILESVPFDLVTVHDEFKCHANYVNQMRIHYRNILADIADSDIMQSILNQLYKPQHKSITFRKESDDLSSYILNSNYAIC